MPSRKNLALILAAALLAATSACTITWREPRLEPLNTNRFYAAALPDACSAAERVVTGFGLQPSEVRTEDRGCLLETDWKVLPDTGEDPINHLRRVAIIGPNPFIGGRYTVTITGRSSRDEGTRVKVTTRVEGYISEEIGYQVLRSSGLIEDRMFTAIGEELGTPPVETR